MARNFTTFAPAYALYRCHTSVWGRKVRAT